MNNITKHIGLLNAVPADLQEERNVRVFKSNLKKYLVNKELYTLEDNRYVCVVYCFSLLFIYSVTYNRLVFCLF